MALIAAKELWLENNGFTPDGITYSLIMYDTYSIKEKLKDLGFKYLPAIGWHIPDAAVDLACAAPYNFFQFNTSDHFIWNEEMGMYFAKQETVETYNKACFAYSPFKNSEYVGAIKYRLTFPDVRLIDKKSYTTKFGTKYNYFFLFNDKDLLIWNTNKPDDAYEIGELYNIAATVSHHSKWGYADATFINRPARLGKVD